MKFLFIVDALDTIKPEKDTSYFLMQAVAERNHDLFYCLADDLYSDHNKTFAVVHTIHPVVNEKPDLSLSQSSNQSLDDFDVIWIRNNPPFDRRYFYLTLLLSLVDSRVKIINNPQTLRNWNEKLAALKYPDLTPKTYILKYTQAILKLFDHHQSLVLKPIDGFAGKGIEFINADDDEQSKIEKIHRCTHNESHWIVIQPFVAEASEGDKRILLINGKPIGAILRLHAEGQLLNNMDAGGRALDVDLTEHDLKICQQLEDDFIKHDIFFCGIDVIGKHLIEINVTSPTGLQELSKFKQHAFHHDCIKALEDTLL